MNNDRSTRFRTTHDRDLSPVTLRSWERGMLRYAVMMVVMIVVAVNTAWGQVGTDYSGKYYIAFGGKQTETAYSIDTPESNFYLCATEDWGYYYYHDGTEDITDENNGQPFLTTYKCKLPSHNYDYANKAVWTIVRNNSKNLYYIKLGERYLVLNGKVSDGAQNRIRVHLEALTSADLETEEIDNKALFEITPNSNGGMKIRPKNTSGYWINVTNGNYDFLTGQKGKNDGPTGFKDVDGTIGIWNAENYEARCYLEDYITRPTITYNDVSDEITITAVQLGVNLIYTTDGSTPSTSNPNAKPITGTSGNTTTVTFKPSDGETTIKAVAVVSGELSNIAKFTTPVFFGSNHKYLIQSQNNGWTIDENTTDFHFYMIPGDEASGVTKVNTTSLFRPSMEWYFLNAGKEDDVQYYYIVNNDESKNLCYDSTNGVYIETNTDNSEKFKFKIVESGTAGSFNIIPYDLRSASGNTARFIYKQNANDKIDAINITKDNNANSRWKFVLPSNLDKTAPFTVSNTSITKYYKIANVGNNGYYIVPPTGNNTNATTSNSADAAVVKSGTWYFEVAQAATASDWCTYYYIRNAETGKFLYFTKDANDAGACLEMKDAESGNEERYKFTWARTATENTYYIIPKFVKDASQNQFSTLRRDGGTLKSNLTRGAGTYAWTFDEAPLFCHNPVFEESGGNIIMSCNTNAAEIRYTTNGQDPKADGVTYLTYPPATPLSASDQHLIKAYAVVSDGTNSAASDDVVILLNKPDITLAAGPYEYKGEAWEPSLTVSIGETGSETTAPTSPETYTATYTNNINAGTATVTLDDADDEDLWYIWNGSTTFTINPKAITITADSDTKGYDGTPLTNDGYTCDPSLATGDSFESVTVTGSQTDVGSSDNVPSDAVIKNGNNEDMTANYTITYANGTLTVTLRSIGNGSLASGFTIEFGEGGVFILKDGEEILTKDTDYSIGSETTSESGKYIQRTVSGTGNYTGYFAIRNANVNFQNDGNGGTEYSATFVAENAAGPASNNSDNGHKLPEGIKAYIITSIVGNYANAVALDYIPEGIPVLLLSNVASGGFLVQDASGHTAITSTQISNNMLVETSEATHFNVRTIYLLYMNEFVYNMAGDLAKGKVYLDPNHNGSGGGDGSRLQIMWNTESGIDHSHLLPLTSYLSGTWYTLDGRRLNGKPTQKGLYLCNGRKIVVR